MRFHQNHWCVRVCWRCFGWPISSLLLSFACYGSDEEKAKQDPAYHLKTTNLETRETLAELYKDYKGDQLLASTMKEPEAKKTDKLNAVRKNITSIKRTVKWKAGRKVVKISIERWCHCNPPGSEHCLSKLNVWMTNTQKWLIVKNWYIRTQTHSM